MGGINGDITRYNPHTDTYSYYNEDCISTIIKDSNGDLLFGGNQGTTSWLLWKRPAAHTQKYARPVSSAPSRKPKNCFASMSKTPKQPTCLNTTTI